MLYILCWKKKRNLSEFGPILFLLFWNSTTPTVLGSFLVWTFLLLHFSFNWKVHQHPVQQCIIRRILASTTGNYEHTIIHSMCRRLEYRGEIMIKKLGMSFWSLRHKGVCGCHSLRIQILLSIFLCRICYKMIEWCLKWQQVHCWG